MNPTEEFYTFWEYLYNFYNGQLFNGELKKVMFTITRKKNTLGYFSPKRWENTIDGELQKLDELAMNPTFFKNFSIEHIMATLVHEMCHVWQFQFGHVTKQVSKGYHNKAWVKKMIAVGLQPSNTGEEGGKQTGYQMHHYILEDGQFAHATEMLKTIADFKKLWVDVNSVRNESLEDLEGEEEEAAEEPKKKPTRIKYVCACTNIYGGVDLNITCNECGEAFAPAE